MVSENRSIPCRVLVCFLACLVFFWAVIPPLNASATEVVATLAFFFAWALLISIGI